MYKVDQLYDKASEKRELGLTTLPLNINWQINRNVIVSEKDLVLPSFDQIDRVLAIYLVLRRKFY
jgi:dTDP-4-dehydrorhamnose 3,5-epimerase-like enzyme